MRSRGKEKKQYRTDYCILESFRNLTQKKNKKKGNQKLKGYQNGLGNYSHWYT